jgi:hypothetical protein
MDALTQLPQIATILFVAGGPTEDAINKLLRQLEIGVPGDALGITDIPVDLARGDLPSTPSRNVW